MPRETIRLGDQIEDIVSKVRGIAVGHIDYLDGTSFWVIQLPIGEDAEKPREYYAPDNYCIRIGDGVYPATKPPVGFHIREIKS